MARRTSKVRKSRDQARAPDALEPKRSDRLRPVVELSELVINNQIRNALSAHQKLTDPFRTSMRLPNLDEILKQATAAAAQLPTNFDGVVSARDLARTAASTKPASIEHEPEASVPLAKQVETRPVLAITCAHDLGQLVRQEREKRKLSQQAFADLAGVGRRFISELENGKATLEFDKALQVASAAGIDVLVRPRQ